jgi:hypothetical protein
MTKWRQSQGSFEREVLGSSVDTAAEAGTVVAVALDSSELQIPYFRISDNIPLLLPLRRRNFGNIVFDSLDRSSKNHLLNNKKFFLFIILLVINNI